MNDRYARQTALEEVGQKGQTSLTKAHVAIVGCGGLGAIAAAYLAGAGVGTISLIDGDKPDISNVHRQVFYTGQESESKSRTLQKKLNALNPNIKIYVSEEFLNKQNIDSIITGADIIMECTDSVMCKYLVNDYAAIEQIPLIYGAIHKYEGYVATFINESEDNIHLRDIFPYPDESIPTCAEVGVLNSIAGIIGLLQANEVLKLILDIGEPLVDQLLTYDCLTNRQLILKAKKSWTEDLEEYYDKYSYEAMDCSFVAELDINDLMQSRAEYQLISILPDHEHHAIDEDTAHSPSFSADSASQIIDAKPIVLYCKTGRQSKQLAAKILTALPHAKILSLKGGLKAYKRFKALN